MSSFREIVFIDADAVFLVNPETLFQNDQYAETGALFYKDRLIMPDSKRAWLENILPEPVSDQVKQNRLWTGASGHMQESGVVVVDKWQHFVALLLVTRLNGPDRLGDEEAGTPGVYDMMFGDKETFWLGWELSGDLDYAFANGTVGTMTSNAGVAGDANYTVCERQLLHADAAGRPVWFNGGLEPRNATSGSPNFDVFVLEMDGRPKSDPWKLLPDNVVCLTVDAYYAFTLDEKEALDLVSSVDTPLVNGAR